MSWSDHNTSILPMESNIYGSSPCHVQHVTESRLNSTKLPAMELKSVNCTHIEVANKQSKAYTEQLGTNR